MADQRRDQQYYELMKARHQGLGNADTTREEWFSNIKKDTYASMVAHHSLLEYYSVGVDQPMLLSRVDLIAKMAEQPQEKEG